jgi:TRAP-type mannitol/chloroaromatic compound transport system permease large subunit
VLIFLVLGTLALGLATPTEGGAMGAVGAILLAVLHNEKLGLWGQRAAYLGFAAILALSALGLIDVFIPGTPAILHTLYKALFVVLYGAIVALLLRTLMLPELRGLIKQAYESTMRITSMVVFILIGSTCFSLVFQGVDGGLWVEHLLTGLPGGVAGFLIVVNLFVFVLAFFLDFFEIAFIVVPMLAPVAQKMLAPVVGPDAALIWFGVILCVNMQTSFMHPPFGFALFYLRAVAPKEIKTSEIYWGAIPWVGLQLIMVLVVILWPQLVTVLLSGGPTADPSKIEIQIPSSDAPEDAPIEVK